MFVLLCPATLTWSGYSVFLGTKLVFWDMRETFIDGLYKISVSQARMQMVVDGLDPVSILPSDVFIS